MGNIVVRYAVYCKACFFQLVQSRFRKSLEPSINPVPDGHRWKPLKAAGSLVLGFSGGTCSTAMLDLVAMIYFSPRVIDVDNTKGGKSHPRNTDRRVWTNRPAVCYVETCGASLQSDRIELARERTARYPIFEFVPLRLEDCFDHDWWERVGGDPLSSFSGVDMSDGDLRLSHAISSSIETDATPHDRLRSFLSSLPTQTALQRAVEILIRLLLLHTAAARNASHLLLGTSLTSLSVNLISGIAQGTGFSIADESQEEWTPRHKDGLTVRVIRPLREIGVKECAIWNWWNELHPINGLVQKEDNRRSAIGALTRDFIFGLETDYPATVSTIARTCAKLVRKEEPDDFCAMCQRSVQPNIHAWKGQISIRSYSDAVSAVSGNYRPSHLTEEEISTITLSTPRPLESSSLAPQLCYGCNTLLTSRSSRGQPIGPISGDIQNITIPMWTRHAISKQLHDVEVRHVQLSRDQMKAEIGEFLIDEDSI